MKKTLFTLFTAINLALLYCPAAFALTEDEAAAAVDAHGKDAVSGNLFLWLLCAIAFLKVSTKLDGILHSLGIGVSRSPGSMLSEALLAFRGFEIGKAFMGLGAAKAAASTATTKVTRQYLCRRAFRHGEPPCAAKYGKLHQWAVRRYRCVLGRCHVLAIECFHGAVACDAAAGLTGGNRPDDLAGEAAVFTEAVLFCRYQRC